LQQIGEGGFGVVFMAEQDQSVHRRVALKVIKPGMDSAQVIARFEAERQALALMDHQNIAKVYDAGTTAAGRPYFVMELVHGIPITRYCDDNHRTVRERLELFVPVCKAIQHAHQKGIIHRDLKPSNVLVCLYDGQPVPKVIDFGVAKAIEQRLTERTMFTHYGQIIGTFEYMSPEQAEMSQLGVDTRSDIYSLGVLLYELLTGPTPLHLLEKPSPGTGATLLGDLITFLSLGYPITVMTEGRDEDEWRKRIFAKLRSGPPVVEIDNLRRRLDSAALSSAITAYPAWEDRLLGVSEVARVPVRCLWLATGSNPSISAEIARRTVRIRLDAKQDRPWLRKGFRHPKIREWAAQNRARLVASILTLVRAWLQAGRPPGEKTLGMFESWSEVIGGILVVARVPGFLGNLSELYEKSDAEGAAWRTFLAAWWEKHRTEEKTVNDLFPLAEEIGELQLGDGKDQSRKIRLGKLLSGQRDRVYGVKAENGEEVQLRIEQAGTTNRATKWALRRRM
jgi:serine/threonine protein kinase